MSRDFQRFNPSIFQLPDDPEYKFCIDCKLEKEKERFHELRCLLCQRAYDQKMKELGS